MYEPLTAAMNALASCTPEYNGEQAQAVAKLLSQWDAKWMQESELHGKALDRIAALEAELATIRKETEDFAGYRLAKKYQQERDRLREELTKANDLNEWFEKRCQWYQKSLSDFREECAKLCLQDMRERFIDEPESEKSKAYVEACEENARLIRLDLAPLPTPRQTP